MLRLLSQTLAVLVITAVTLASLPALHAQQTFAHGAVVALRGTPHLWIADAQGVLHWGGDTRALAGKHVNWGDRTEVTLAQLRGLPVGDPWLSAGLLKDGDPIYLVKWESDWERPRLLHIQSIADVELFGIDGSNYGRFVLDRATWEARYGMSAASLERSALPAAVPTGEAAPTETPRPTIDPRLQPALDLIASAETGARQVEYAHEQGVRFVIAPIPDRAGQTIGGTYSRSSNTITVSDTFFASAPVEVVAGMLVHELVHVFPTPDFVKQWNDPVRICMWRERMAEMNTAFYWNEKYGAAGSSIDHPHAHRLNLLAAVVRAGVESGTHDGFDDYVNEYFADICATKRVALTPTPTPAPGGFDLARVEHVFRFLDVFARRILAEMYGVSPNGIVASRLADAYALPIRALPSIYIMHLWAVGGPESGHTLVDIDAFGRAYFNSPKHYAAVAVRWLSAYLANPCSVSAEARAWVISVEEPGPGTLAGSIRMILTYRELQSYAIDDSHESSREALFNDPNRYRCVAR